MKRFLKAILIGYVVMGIWNLIFGKKD